MFLWEGATHGSQTVPSVRQKKYTFVVTVTNASLYIELVPVSANMIKYYSASVQQQQQLASDKRGPKTECYKWLVYIYLLLRMGEP